MVFRRRARALAAPAFYVALSLMGVGSLARAAGFPVGAAMLSTALVWAGPGQLLFFGAASPRRPRLPAIAFAVSLSSVRLLPMCLSVLPMLRGRQTRLSTLLAAAHFIAVTVWAESLRRLPDWSSPTRLPFFFGVATTCMGLTTILDRPSAIWLTGSLPEPLGGRADDAVADLFPRHHGALGALRRRLAGHAVRRGPGARDAAALSAAASTCRFWLWSAAAGPGLIGYLARRAA